MNTKANRWKEKYLSLIKKIAKTHPEFTAEVVRRAFFKSRIGNPGNHHQFGACFRRALKRGFMERTGEFRRSNSGNRNAQPVYKSLMFKEAYE